MWYSLPSDCTAITTGSVMQNIQYTYHTNNNLAPEITWFTAFFLETSASLRTFYENIAIRSSVRQYLYGNLKSFKGNVRKFNTGQLYKTCRTISILVWIDQLQWPFYLKIDLYPCLNKCSYPANTLREHNKVTSSCKNVNFVFQTFYVS